MQCDKCGACLCGNCQGDGYNPLDDDEQIECPACGGEVHKCPDTTTLITLCPNCSVHGCPHCGKATWTCGICGGLSCGGTCRVKA
jgi:hypothetical protein